MDAVHALTAGLDEVRGVVHGTVTGLTADQLCARPGPQANTVAWLVWHLTRVLDDHVAPPLGREQVWFARGWVERLGFPFPPPDDGYGHSPDDVAAVRVEDGGELLEYFDAVHVHTLEMLDGVGPEQLDHPVSTPHGPVPLGSRLVRTFVDVTQHAGQAAFVRGLVVAR